MIIINNNKNSFFADLKIYYLSNIQYEHISYYVQLREE